MVFPVSHSPSFPPTVCVQVYVYLCVCMYMNTYISVVFQWQDDFPFLPFNLNGRDVFLCYFLCIHLAVQGRVMCQHIWVQYMCV